MNGMTRDVRILADGIGILGSAACTLHCLVTPVLLVAGATLPASFLADDTFHRLLLWAILPATIIALGLGYSQHKDGRILVLGFLGVVGITSAFAAPHDLVGESGERFLTVGSAGLLIGAHLRNFNRCRADRCNQEAARGW